MKQKSNIPNYLLSFFGIVILSGLMIFFAEPLKYATGWGARGCIVLGEVEAIAFTSVEIILLGALASVIAANLVALKKYSWRIFIGSFVAVIIFILGTMLTWIIK